MMAAEIMMARQLTYFAARQKDSGRRCDLEAGMAKLLGRARRLVGGRQRRADPRRQRLLRSNFRCRGCLCDARIFSIFEGAAEIQAQVIARRLLDGANA